ncbi:accessory gene regulator ArgB-like protein [Cohnella soli]|uniref:Accessory gene regulator ArgB-like protein n=1 Tax=Cohnella soli TaxID=425005 RepID=A0ABW0HP50_9BACL
MISAISLRIATYLKNVDQENTPSIEVMKYSLYIILHTLFTVCAITIVSFILGKPFETFIGLIFFIALRLFGGGYHLHSSVWCTVLSVGLVSASPFLVLSDSASIVVTIASVLIFLWQAPKNFKGYARIPEKYYPVMKVITVIIGSANFIWNSSTLSAILLLQSILLLPKEKGGTS